MIFVSSADRVQLLTDFLNEKKLKARGFYAQLKDEARAEIIESFHEKKFK
jgi:superfamily II DNA/RNA helicase